jgi:hypothetical protein
MRQRTFTDAARAFQHRKSTVARPKGFADIVRSALMPAP